MKIDSIKQHLQPYSIFKKRQTTINHAFASAIAPADGYDINLVKNAIKLLGQEPDRDLICIYCDEPAETWDHVFGLVREFQFAGFGHIIGNLLPSCKKCNSKKGNKNWEDFLINNFGTNPNLQKKIDRLKTYFLKFLPIPVDYNQIKKMCPEEISELEIIKSQIMTKMVEADKIASVVRQKVKDEINKLRK